RKGAALPRKSRRPGRPEFRQQMVEEAAVGRAPSELGARVRRNGDVAPQLDPADRNWVRPAAIGAGKPPPGEEALTLAEREEIVPLRRENRRLQVERDILAKAMAADQGRVHAVFELVRTDRPA